jgi:catechol 2,3-dioxygenase-like lactoylglutathione lyase family enzyme
MKSIVVRALGVSLGVAAIVNASAKDANPAQTEHGHFHHIHINVSDIAKTTAFYEKVFGVVPIRYGNQQTALMAERSFVFMNQIEPPIKSQLQTGIIHIGWSGIDGKSEFAWWQKEGVEFYTPLTPFGPGNYMYLYGPDREVIEIWTNERHHRLNHVHMLSTNPKETAEWFARVIHSDTPAELGAEGLGNYNLKADNVTLHIFPDSVFFKPKERQGAIQPTDGSGIDHVSFSFRDLKAAFDRVYALGVPIERSIAKDRVYGIESFYIRAPNGVLVEFVKAKPLPDAAWE